jgi:DNA-binding MarR family transcriptional regulator
MTLSNNMESIINDAPKPEIGRSPATENPPDAPAATSAEQAVVDRASLERELLDEMMSWFTRDRGGVFKSFHRHALSLVHLNVLTALEAQGPLSMRRLAEEMDVSDASATGIVDRMEKRSLVERRHDTADRRVVLVYPTDAGAQVFANMATHRREALTRVLSELSEPEMVALLTGIRAMQVARHKVLASNSWPSAPPEQETQPRT